MRQAMSQRRVRQLAKQTGLEVLVALTRGNTNHRIDLLVRGGAVFYLFKDGELALAEDLRWDYQRWLDAAPQDERQA